MPQVACSSGDMRLARQGWSARCASSDNVIYAACSKDQEQATPKVLHKTLRHVAAEQATTEDCNACSTSAGVTQLLPSAAFMTACLMHDKSTHNNARSAMPGHCLQMHQPWRGSSLPGSCCILILQVAAQVHLACSIWLTCGHAMPCHSA